MEFEHISKTPQFEVEKIKTPSYEKRKRSAQGKQFEMEFIKCLISKVPEIRKNKVEQAKQRLRSGVYSRKDLSEQIAERIIARMGSNFF
jgi:hypothetical protein